MLPHQSRMTARGKTRRGDQAYTRSTPKNWKPCPSKTLPSKQNLDQLRNSVSRLDQFASLRLRENEKQKRTLVATDELIVGRDEHWKCISLLFLFSVCVVPQWNLIFCE